MNHSDNPALQAQSWPFQEARRLAQRFDGQTPEKGFVLFETGYGPSGLPHIGTFGEVVRTSMVRQAFSHLSDLPTKLFIFSDDMDGLRKVPDTIPNQEMMHAHLGQPLTRIPDPFGQYESFGHHNNAQLRRFLDFFGFDYEFQSATDWYQSGRFDSVVMKILNHYDKVINVILPTLGPERRATYSPFLPLCPETGKVLQVEVIETRPGDGTIIYRHPSGRQIETPVGGGRCKLQWKVDWAMRWLALGVDYEMSGKDLTDSVRLSGRIAKILGGSPPNGFTYELFLDENGEKISKSKGNGLSVEDWLHYAPQESLALFMYHAPRRAKRLYFDVIPRAMDDYLSHLAAFPQQTEDKVFDNPAWHVHSGPPPHRSPGLNYSLLLNLASVCHAENKETIWGFIEKYAPQSTPQNDPLLDRMAACTVAYYKKFIQPHKSYRSAQSAEKEALRDLSTCLADLPENSDAETIQTMVYEVGKRHDFSNLRDWFRTLYEVLLGQSEGPRMGSFIALYGIQPMIRLIDQRLADG